MCYFSISLLLIAAGYVLGADSLPVSTTSLLEGALLTVFGAFFGTRLSVYLNHHDEYAALRYQLRQLVALAEGVNTPDFEPIPRQARGLTEQERVYLLHLKATLNAVAGEMRRSHHKRLAIALEEAAEHFKQLDSIPNIGGIHRRAQELADKVARAKPSQCGLIWNSLVYSRMLVDNFYIASAGQ